MPILLHSRLFLHQLTAGAPYMNSHYLCLGLLEKSQRCEQTVIQTEYWDEVDAGC